MQKRNGVVIFDCLTLDHPFVKRIIFIAFLLGAFVLAEPVLGDVRESLERIYAEEALQKELVSDDFRGLERLIEWMSENAQLLGYALLALGLFALLMLLFVFVDSRSPALFRNQRSAGGNPSESGLSSGIATESVSALLAQADALADCGRYGEAIHSLLVGLLNWLRRDLGLDWQPAQTAREVAAHRDASGTLGLWDLVRVSEQAYFGGYELGEDSYKNCRASFSQIVSKFSTDGKAK